MNDLFYVQGAYSDGTISHEQTVEDEETSLRRASSLMTDPCFEGDFVRVITNDGELVWDSRSTN